MHQRLKVNDDDIHRDDDASNTLHGNGSLDWFWTSDEDLADRISGQETENESDLFAISWQRAQRLD